MAGRIPQQFIDELIGRADIVELINARVPLKKAGREFRACCPFHNEKTPSFWVSPTKQFYHCFGCGAHGTALGFLMEYEQLSFVEAVEELAGRLGIEVPREAGSVAPSPVEDQSELLGRVAGFYEECLRANARARDYVRQRGLAPGTVERFRIGYAPDSWNEVLKHFGATEESRSRLLATGMIKERDTPRPGSEPWYDHFRDRLMFPIRDVRGRVLGFGGRVLDKGEPKYLNTPETALFHKGQELYGLYELRQARTALRRLLIVEGYMDVVRLHQAGIGYAVATLGTSTTPQHLTRAFRLVSELVFCFDGDKAGRGAAWRALQNVLPEVREGREIRFLFLPEGEDPDSLVGKEGREAFEQRLDAALPLSEYLLQHLRAEVDLGNADGRAHYIALARPLLEKLRDEVYRELLIARIAEEVGLDAGRLAQLLPAARGDRGDRGERVDRSDRSEGSGRAGGSGGGLVGIGGSGGSGSGAAGGDASRADARGERSTHVRHAIKLLLHEPSAAESIPDSLLPALATLEERGADILRELLAGLKAAPALSMAQTLERWRGHPAFVHLERLAQEERLLAPEAAGPELLGTLTRLLEEAGSRRRQGRLRELQQRLAEGSLSVEESKELQALMRAQATRG